MSDKLPAIAIKRDAIKRIQKHGHARTTVVLRPLSSDELYIPTSRILELIEKKNELGEPTFELESLLEGFEK